MIVHRRIHTPANTCPQRTTTDDRREATGCFASDARTERTVPVCESLTSHATYLLAMPSVSDINELNLPKTCQTEFPDPDDLLNFKLIICPDEVSG